MQCLSKYYFSRSPVQGSSSQAKPFYAFTFKPTCGLTSKVFAKPMTEDYRGKFITVNVREAYILTQMLATRQLARSYQE